MKKNAIAIYLTGNDPLYNTQRFLTAKHMWSFYLEGLKINPKHVGINEYLGELYIATNRVDKAKERLKVLETCNCEEYSELKNLINQN